MTGRPDRMLRAALRYAALGWKVFPCHPKTKIPLQTFVPNGHTQAVDDPKVIRKWWGKVPDANIGLHLAGSGLIAVDEDPRDGGSQTLKDFEATHGKLNAPLLSKSGGLDGGRHHIFAAPEGLRKARGKLGKGVQVKYNGYIVLAPSLHPDGKRYEWVKGNTPFDNLEFLTTVPPAVLDRKPVDAAATAELDDDDPLNWRDTKGPVDLDADTIRRKTMLVPREEDYGHWLNMGMALRHQYPEDDDETGLDLWLEWSEGYGAGFDEDECRSKWESFQRNYEDDALSFRWVLKQARAVEDQLAELDEALAEDEEAVDLAEAPSIGLEEASRLLEDSDDDDRTALDLADDDDEDDELGGDALGSDTEADSQPETAGDVEFGRLFHKAYGGSLLYIHSASKWAMWGGKRWIICNCDEQVELAKQFVGKQVVKAKKRITAAALESAADPENAIAAAILGKAKADYKAATDTYKSIGKIEAVLKSARTIPGMSKPDLTAFDTKPMLLGVQNGTVDLTTGELVKGVRSQMITQATGVAYDPKAKAPMWEKFIRDVFPNDTAMQGYIQRMAGYMLTGSVEEEALFFAHGQGANGKSVLANVFSAVWGDYAGVVGGDLLRLRGGNSSALEKHGNLLAGKRLALANEISAEETWDDQLVKSLVSTEKMIARRLYENPYEFTPSHKLFVRGNNMPTSKDRSDGVWRRMHVIGFEQQFGKDVEIRNLGQILVEKEGPGILAWAVRGCLEWQKRGLGRPAEAAAAVEEFRKSIDPISMWMDEMTVLDTAATISTRDLFDSFCAWGDANRERPMSMIAFSRKLSPTLKKLKVALVHRKTGNHYSGVRLKTDAERGAADVASGFEEDDDSL